MNEKEKNTVIIAERQRIFRDALRALLNESGFKIVGETGTGTEAIICAKKLKPDLMLMGLSLLRVDGLSALKAIKKKSRKTKVLVLTANDTEKVAFEALTSGADGYVLKSSGYDELLYAIGSALHGKSCRSSGISNGCSEADTMARDPNAKPPLLTRRETEIIRLVATGYKNEEIAGALFIAPSTVKNHKKNMMAKLGCRSSSALTAYALRNGFAQKNHMSFHRH